MLLSSGDEPELPAPEPLKPSPPPTELAPPLLPALLRLPASFALSAALADGPESEDTGFDGSVRDAEEDETARDTDASPSSKPPLVAW